jgi:hypothetical protein
MNQRIKELIAQCMAEKNLSIKSIDGWHYTGMAKVLDPDKFAELIVRECASIIEEEDGDSSSILKSFGIE